MFSRAVVVLAAVLVLAGCGDRSPTLRPGRCSPQDMAMQCKHVGPTVKIAPAPVPVVAYGIDFAWGCYDQAGSVFGASYLSTDLTKNWTAQCLARYRSESKSTVMVWETYANRALSGFAGGQQDARQALSQAVTLGLLATRPIYFAVDFDETPAQAATVAAYFQGVNSVLGAARTGGYGGYWTVSRLFDAGVIRYGWQTSAWSGGQWDARAQLQQYAYPGAYDWDRAMVADYGQSPYQPPKPKPKPAKVRWSSAEVQLPGDGTLSLTLKGGHWTHSTGRLRSLPYNAGPLGG